ncbi:peptidase inhibitor 16 [Elgaria multicarinata webbii]|uniref:peptidase inhibitor 16 n=1 Tax=Elgaria multicarinata webbii TaxID=159646 RepID=UPI002FCCD123
MLSSGLRIPLLPLLLLWLTLMELSWSFTEKDKKLIVDRHNWFRSQVSPPAADMLKLSWDPELEAFAKDYAEKCAWKHNEERGQRGENLLATSGDLDLENAVEEWYKENQYYNMTTLTCEEDQMCGHYTQVVWATSERVGCGTVFCETLHLTNDTDMNLLVCNYEPPGNVIGHKPYKEGAPCSMCPDGYSCKDSLCASSADVDATIEPTIDDSTSKATTASPDPTKLETTAILTTRPTLPPTSTSASGDIPETLTTGPEVESQPTTTKDTTDNFTPSPSPLIPQRSTPKSPSIPKPRPTPIRPTTAKTPPPPRKAVPFRPPPPPLKKAPISKTPARHRLAAYAKAIKGQHNAEHNDVRSSAHKAASMSVCLPCLGCKKISQAEEIKAALKELSSRYPYAPCFSPLPRWQRHSKCSWCGHTWGNALRKARPYWLNSL